MSAVTHEKRNVLLLASAQALFQTVSVLVMTVGALAGARVSPEPWLATAPIAAMFLGTATVTWSAASLMARRGRRTGFILGTFLGVLGGVLGAAGIWASSLALLALGTFLVGLTKRSRSSTASPPPRWLARPSGHAPSPSSWPAAS
jgi:hypothetical protein